MDGCAGKPAFDGDRKIKMVSIGAEYSGHLQPSLVSQAKENMNRLPGYL
jgi:hypothetical protein